MRCFNHPPLSPKPLSKSKTHHTSLPIPQHHAQQVLCETATVHQGAIILILAQAVHLTAAIFPIPHPSASSGRHFGKPRVKLFVVHGHHESANSRKTYA